MILERIEVEADEFGPAIAIEGDDDPDSPDLRISFQLGWLYAQADLTPQKLAQLRDAIEEALRKIERCEHGIEEGDWCAECNREYKAAMGENE
jgi:hypothetical protein